MSRIVTALFKDRAKAEQALQSILAMGIAQHRITTLGLTEGREVSSISGFRTLEIPDESRASLHGLGLPADDVTLFEHGLRRGCCLIAVQVDRDKQDEAVRALEMFDPLDLDQESRERTGESRSGQSAGDDAGSLGAGLSGGQADGQSNTGSLPGMGTLADNGGSLGTADLRTDETGQPSAGDASTVPTGRSTDGGRENMPGANALRQPTTSRAPDTGMLQREMNRRGPVWTYGTD